MYKLNGRIVEIWKEGGVLSYFKNHIDVDVKLEL